MKACEDYKINFIPEDTTIKELTKSILKKGKKVERQYVLRKLEYSINTPEEILEIITLIYPVLDIWEESLQILYAEKISLICRKIIQNKKMRKKEKYLKLINKKLC